MSETSSGWTTADIPDQSGRTIMVTGANSGLGLQTAKALAGAGARVLMACRSADRAAAAIALVESAVPDADLEFVALDLSDLASVEAAAAAVTARPDPLDVLVNNAGVMATPRRRTADGFELQFGTNHLGHFALTGRLVEKLLAAEAPRVVTVSSVAHKAGRMDFDDLMWDGRYWRWQAYGRSKLANLLFTLELARRAEAAGTDLIAAAAHPGYAATNLTTNGPTSGRFGVLLVPMMKVSDALFGQSESAGALPSLYAATAPGVAGDDYIGPDGIGEQRGHPTRVGRTGRAANGEDAKRLWDVSEQLTGVSFGALDEVGP